MSHNLQPFRYDWICFNNNVQITRLLRPRKSAHNLLSFEIKTVVPLAAAGRYTALSYVWGNRSNSPQIELVDLEQGISGFIHVTANLHTFLQQYQTSKEWFWIDAICINQQSLEERAYQVKQMGDIYRRAEEVFVWLGNDPNIVAFFELDQQRGFKSLFRRSNSSIEIRDTKSTEALIHAFESHVYWTRLWIQQELILANRIYFCAGNHCMLDRAVAQLATSKHIVVNMGGGGRECWDMIDARIQLGRPSDRQRPYVTFPKPLLHYLEDTPKPDCFDIRDQIYGILALVHDGPSLQVDYNIEPSELFYRVLNHFQLGRLESKDLSHFHLSGIKHVLDRLGLDLITMIEEEGKREIRFITLSEVTVKTTTYGATMEASMPTLEERGGQEGTSLIVIQGTDGNLSSVAVVEKGKPERRRCFRVNGVKCSVDGIRLEPSQEGSDVYVATMPHLTLLLLLILTSGKPSELVQGHKLMRQFWNQEGEDCNEYQVYHSEKLQASDWRKMWRKGYFDH